ncbi:Hypothetical protein, putative, partial [Bodo saltans]
WLLLLLQCSLPKKKTTTTTLFQQLSCGSFLFSILPTQLLNTTFAVCATWHTFFPHHTLRTFNEKQEMKGIQVSVRHCEALPSFFSTQNLTFCFLLNDEVSNVVLLHPHQETPNHSHQTSAPQCSIDDDVSPRACICLRPHRGSGGPRALQSA